MKAKRVEIVKYINVMKYLIKIYPEDWNLGLEPKKIEDLSSLTR